MPAIAALIDPRQFELVTRPTSGLIAVQGSAGSGKCWTDNNYNQVAAGRAHQSGGYVFADGSNQNMGLWNLFTVHTLEQTGADYYVIADGGC